MAKAKTVDGGLLLIFEGLDGAGKTTQINLAAEAYRKRGFQVHLSRNLGGSPIGEKLREVLLSPIERPPRTNFFIGVAVQEALIEVLNEERAKGSIILLDRGPMSLVAYQSYAKGVDEELSWQYADRGFNSLKPEQILYLDISINEALKRSRSRNQVADFFESKPREYYEKVSALLSSGAKRYAATTIDAGASIEHVHQSIVQEIDAQLEKKQINRTKV